MEFVFDDSISFQIVVFPLSEPEVTIWKPPPLYERNSFKGASLEELFFSLFLLER